jgi:hypothetical protein
MEVRERSTQSPTPRLIEAFCKVQEKLEIIHKDQKGRFTYASLEQIIKEVKPILSEAGLHVLQAPGFFSKNSEGVITLNTTIYHRSGEKVEMEPFQMPIQNRTGSSIQQNIGTAITYARRYQLCGLLNIGTQDIDPDDYELPIDNKIHPEDLDKITEGMLAKNITNKELFEKFGIRTLTDLKANDFAKVMNFIKAYKK